jgi:hypothetical protein
MHVQARPSQLSMASHATRIHYTLSHKNVESYGTMGDHHDDDTISPALARAEARQNQSAALFHRQGVGLCFFLFLFPFFHTWHIGA